MKREYIKNELITVLCKDFQSVWLIKTKDLSLEIFFTENNKAAPGAVSKALDIKSYDDAREWYINTCVAESSRRKLTEQTPIEHVLAEVANGKPFCIEYTREVNGKTNFNQLYYDKIDNPDSGKIEYVVMGFRNIDVSKKAEIDDLTGLYIRPVFFRKAEEILSENPDAQYDLIISDIVDFKKINETYGIKVADSILRWEAKYLLSRKYENVLFGRYGGDQIAIFGTHEGILKVISDESKELFYNAEKNNDLPDINIKFGVIQNVDHEKSIISTCDKAHMALNSIKHHYVKDIAFYDSQLMNHVDKQRRIESSMYKSLQDGDFKVYYQPKHEAATGELIGAEALIRWEHPKYGFMSPADFIPLFEQNGFIIESDRYVWDRTCENIRRWQDKGIKMVPISVNGSKLTLLQDNLVKVLRESVVKNNLNPSQLHIEITETIMEDISSEMVDKINMIRDYGIKVELDDFGSGYSSLNALSELPIDILKLDMSFLFNFGDERRLMVLESCIDLAKKLGFTSVSEGVETKEQKELLKELGIDIIQGYYYSKPLPEEAFEEYLKENGLG